MKQNQVFTKLAIVTAVTLALSACGGSSSEPTPPPVNQVPTISPISAKSVDERQSINIEVIATDSDGSIASYSWIQTSGPEIELQNANTKTVTFTAPTVDAAQMLKLSVTVRDNGGATATASVDININNTHIETGISGNVMSMGTDLAGADVIFSFDEITATTITDSNGDYSLDLEIPLSYELKPFSITATQNQTRLSTVGYIDSIVLSDINSQQSANLMKVSASSYGEFAVGTTTTAKGTSVNLNEVTTAETELLKSLFADGDAFYAEIFTSISDFALQYDHISTEKLAELSSFLVYMKTNNISAPEPFSFDNLLTLMESYASSDGNFVTAMSAASVTVLSSTSKPESFSGITEAVYPLTIIPVLESAKNTVRLGINFDAVYRFDSPTIVTLFDNDAGNYSASWVVNEDGSLTLTRSSATGRFIWQSGPGNITYGQHGNCSHSSLSEDWFMLNKRGNAADSVVININWSVQCDDGFSDQYVNKRFASMVNQENAKSFRDNDVSGKTLAMELPGDEIQGDNFTVALLSFSADGSGSVIETSEQFSWGVENGVLTVSFASGDETSFIKVQENQQGAFGIAQLYHKATGETLSNKGMMLVTNSNSIFDSMSNYAGRLRSGFDVSQPNQQREIGFIVELEANGNSKQESRDASGNLNPAFSRVTTWGIIEGKIIISTKFNGITNERCDPYTNSECWWEQIRTWELLAKHGNRIYVKESIRRNFGKPENNLAFPSLVDSRLNFYEIN